MFSTNFDLFIVSKVHWFTIGLSTEAKIMRNTFNILTACFLRKIVIA